MSDLRTALDRFLADKYNRWGLIFLLSLAEILLLAGMVMFGWVWVQNVGPDRLAALLPAKPTPTPPCAETSLLIGSTTFAVKQLSGEPVTTLELPAADGNLAYQFTGAPAGSYVFGLNPSPAALSLRGSLETGGQVRIIWPDCSLDDFIVEAVQPGAPDLSGASGEKGSLSIYLPGENGLTIRGMMPSALAATSATADAAEAAATPTCDQPVLVIAGARYPVSPVVPAADGSLAIPLSPAQAVYQVSGTQAYALPADAANLALGSTLHAGDLVTLIADGCASTEYTLAGLQPGATYSPASPPPGLLLFVSGAAPGQGFAVSAQPVTAEQIIVPTTDPNASTGIEAEISLLSVTAVSDSRMDVRVSIHNYGKTAFSLNSTDIQLLPVEAGPYAIQNADPGLPFQVNPGMTQVFLFSFPLPASPGASLRIFTIEYPLVGY
jgi:hypothetical protein